MVKLSEYRNRLFEMMDEYDHTAMLKELLCAMSERECKDFYDHIRRMWELDYYEQNNDYEESCNEEE